jgi:hypothetical protein
MGQRFQILISIPHKFFTNHNVNNELRRTLVYHNQWLYGRRAIEYAAGLMQSLRRRLDHDITSFELCNLKYQDWERSVNTAIEHMNLRDLVNTTTTHPYFDDAKTQDEFRADKKIMDFIKRLDNNNGFLFIFIDRKDVGKKVIVDLSYRLYNGEEDAPKIEERTLEGYLSLFDETTTESEALSRMKRITDKNMRRF